MFTWWQCFGLPNGAFGRGTRRAATAPVARSGPKTRLSLVVAGEPLHEPRPARFDAMGGAPERGGDEADVVPRVAHVQQLSVLLCAPWPARQPLLVGLRGVPLTHRLDMEVLGDAVRAKPDLLERVTNRARVRRARLPPLFSRVSGGAGHRDLKGVVAEVGGRRGGRTQRRKPTIAFTAM
eukprot:scaffold277074_cov28-Tisochrysis_lutea.AAC.2